jgi:hypothetical protein
MNSKDHEKIDPEDHQMFEQLLVEHYKKPYEDSYQLLRERVKAIFRGRDTNVKYRAMLFDDLEDLTLSVIFRLMYINGRAIKEKGEKIRDLESMVRKIADFVYKEKLKAIRKRLNDQPIEENDSAGRALTMRQRIDDEIQAIQDQIRRDCYAACVEKLPNRIKDVFRAYYPNASLSPGELIALRRRLADEAAKPTQAQARKQPPEAEARRLNNLQRKVHKWRKGYVEGCVRKCVEEKQSRHSCLNYLNEQ